VAELAIAADQPYVWLRTTGRRSGRPHTVELWFVADGSTVYFLAGGGERADWVRNSAAEPRVSVRVGAATVRGIARRPERGDDEELRARSRMAAKYQGWRPGRPLSSWATRALCLAVDLDATG
jgi:deazaflavin-dependent oxidoreductase (nitroreductase family)